jgi:hypothetical protein
MLLGLGLHPRPGELLQRRRLSARPERHRNHAGDGAGPRSGREATA